MEHHPRIYVAGRDTLVGSAILRVLTSQGYDRLIQEPEPEVTDPVAVRRWFDQTAPTHVFIAAGKSGGIEANQQHPAELMHQNLLVACHLVSAAYHTGVKKLLYLGSSCSYPRHCPQPMQEESLLTGPLEPTSEAYAVAKIAGIKLCQSFRRQYGARFITGILGDPFGPGDDFREL